ncbi:MAG TPA: Smr/MutS family protein [Candidatus Binataceae bacterium]|nr:Smr/MutS family protein [Candidatus Binataceae bacterium]
MAKKRKHREPVDEPKEPAAPKPVFASPFKDLRKLIAGRELLKPATPPAPPPPKPVEPTDDDILLKALAGVRPLNGTRAARIPIEPVVTHTITSEDAEVIAQLNDLVSGQAPFDITESDEYVEGCRVGLDPRLLSRLRRAEYAMQAHVDLHRLVREDAKSKLEAFVADSVRKGHRAVLVVHGKGLNSAGGQPVLKQACAQWLSHGTIGGHVLAFASARQPDGGAGAMYVLLRRDKRRAPFDVMHGAKLKG